MASFGQARLLLQVFLLPEGICLLPLPGNIFLLTFYILELKTVSLALFVQDF
jgi:hypothetical protein